MKKLCKYCGEEKPITQFNKKKNGKYGVSSKCKPCFSEYYKSYYNKNKKSKINSVKNYYNNNKDSVLKYKKEYYVENRELLIRKASDRKEFKRKTSGFHRMKYNLRKRTSSAFKVNYWTKKSSNSKMLGCSYNEAKSYLESKFVDGMNWDNYGEWHIDHIKPLCSAETKEDLIKLCHYTNLQPLWAKDNLSKGGKY